MNKHIAKKALSCLLGLIILSVSFFSLSACGEAKETVIIYTSAEDYRIENMNRALSEKFPDYDVIVEYIPTGNHAAKLITEGKSTDCDITHNLEYSYLEKLDAKGFLADLSSFDRSIYCEDTVVSNNYIVEVRNSGAIIINTDVLSAKNLSKPTSYDDLLKPEYKGLISMPSPKASGTGYVFIKSLVNSRGEDAAFSYFDKLNENILQYASSGSGPVNALVQGEAAIGLGITSHAVTEINKGAKLEILFFEEGAPFTLYGQSIIKGKETRPAVKEVFKYLINEYNYENNQKFFPEQIYKDVVYEVKNHPVNIKYADMSNNTAAEKERLLGKWKY